MPGRRYDWAGLEDEAMSKSITERELAFNARVAGWLKDAGRG